MFTLAVIAWYFIRTKVLEDAKSHDLHRAEWAAFRSLMEVTLPLSVVVYSREFKGGLVESYEETNLYLMRLFWQTNRRHYNKTTPVAVAIIDNIRRADPGLYAHMKEVFPRIDEVQRAPPPLPLPPIFSDSHVECHSSPFITSALGGLAVHCRKHPLLLERLSRIWGGDGKNHRALVGDLLHADCGKNGRDNRG